MGKEKEEKPESKKSTDEKPEIKKSTEEKPESKKSTEEKQKPSISTEEKPKPSSSTEEKVKSPTSSSSSKQATPTIGKDAFGRESCGPKAEEGPGCHESHEPFLKNGKNAKKEVDNAKVGKDNEGRSAYSKLSQDFVSRQAAPAVTSGAPVAAEKPRGRTSFLGAPKRLQLMRRWLPAAGLYMAATAAVAVWVTEWGPVVNQIPFYRAHEEQNIQKKPPPESEPPELESSSPESQPPALESSESSE